MPRRLYLVPVLLTVALLCPASAAAGQTAAADALVSPRPAGARLAAARVGGPPRLAVPHAPVRRVSHEPMWDDGTPHPVLGGVIGAAVGAGLTQVVVQRCRRNDDRREGPPCEIAYLQLGLPAVLGGALLGAWIGGRG